MRSGTDVARALALGANAALAGKAFLWSVGALGSDGPGHAIDLLIDELQSALGQVGAHSPADARNVMIRHPGALRLRAKSSLICAGGGGKAAGAPIERLRPAGNDLNVGHRRSPPPL